MSGDVRLRSLLLASEREYVHDSGIAEEVEDVPTESGNVVNADALSDGFHPGLQHSPESLGEHEREPANGDPSEKVPRPRAEDHLGEEVGHSSSDLIGKRLGRHEGGRGSHAVRSGDGEDAGAVVDKIELSEEKLLLRDTTAGNTEVRGPPQHGGVAQLWQSLGNPLSPEHGERTAKKSHGECGNAYRQ